MIRKQVGGVKIQPLFAENTIWDDYWKVTFNRPKISAKLFFAERFLESLEHNRPNQPTKYFYLHSVIVDTSWLIHVHVVLKGSTTRLE